MAKKINDAHQFAHLGNLDQAEQSEKKLRDQTNSRSFKEFQKKSNKRLDSNKKGKHMLDSSVKDRHSPIEESYVVGDMDMSGVELDAD